MSEALFNRVAIIGFGLIGSSLGRAIRRHGLVRIVVACDVSGEARAEIAELGLADIVTADPVAAVAGADLVIICTPVGSYAELGRTIAPALAPGAISVRLP